MARSKNQRKAKAVVTSGAVVLTVNDEELREKAQACLKESGKITLNMREVAVSKLGDIVDAAVTVN